MSLTTTQDFAHKSIILDIADHHQNNVFKDADAINYLKRIYDPL